MCLRSQMSCTLVLIFFSTSELNLQLFKKHLIFSFLDNARSLSLHLKARLFDNLEDCSHTSVCWHSCVPCDKIMVELMNRCIYPGTYLASCERVALRQTPYCTFLQGL